MILKNLKVTRRECFFLLICALNFVFVSLETKAQSVQPDVSEIETQIKAVKTEIERPSSSPDVIRHYNFLNDLLNNNKCNAVRNFEKTAFSALAAPTASVCISGASLSASDSTFNRPVTATQGSGFGPFPPGSCTLSGSGTAVRYDAYSFNLTGCTVFPTVVTATLCGPAGCAAPNNLDTNILIYRNVASGDPLTANGGLANVFSAASPCTNARAAQDDLATGTATSAGGSSCNQLNTSDCVPACTGMTSLSGLKRSLGSGQFTVVVAGFSNSTQGNYNLYVDAPGAGCSIAQVVPTAASVNISGRVLTRSGRGIANSILELSGGALSEPIRAKTNQLGYYRFTDVPVGDTYIISVISKRYTFGSSTQVVNLTGEMTNADFISHQ